jgi:hypothetical protein
MNTTVDKEMSDIMSNLEPFQTYCIQGGYVFVSVRNLINKILQRKTSCSETIISFCNSKELKSVTEEIMLHLPFAKELYSGIIQLRHQNIDYLFVFQTKYQGSNNELTLFYIDTRSLIQSYCQDNTYQSSDNVFLKTQSHSYTSDTNVGKSHSISLTQIECKVQKLQDNKEIINEYKYFLIKHSYRNKEKTALLHIGNVNWIDGMRFYPLSNRLCLYYKNQIEDIYL